MTDRFPAQPVLDHLKDFQLASVEHAFHQLYEAGRNRFLVADEVGLGKTMIARGLIAKAIEHLWDDVERIDVIYICSNAGIAKQNVRRLNILPDRGFSFSSRMTLMARDVGALRGNKVNFVSFTPGTSFDLKSSTGQSDERVLLYWLLHTIHGGVFATRPGVVRMFRCGVAEDRWPRQLERERPLPGSIDDDLVQRFATQADHLDARARIDELQRHFASADPAARDLRRARDELVGQLRAALARECVHALEPDLVVLDEFQRFRKLLSGEDVAGELANDLFDHGDNKTLLLSATPYKMFTNAGDDGDDHHRDFLQTVDFLLEGDSGEFRQAMDAFRAGILDAAHLSVDRLRALRSAVERELSSVMVRTERLGAGDDRNGMLTEQVWTGRIDERSVADYVALERLAELADAPGMLEYWKSVPAFLNFCDGYQADHKLEQTFADPERRPEALSLVAAGGERLDWQDWHRFEPIRSGNAQLDELGRQVLADDQWRMLWLAPSLPYHQLGETWGGRRGDFTKRLVFSAWAGTPKSVSALLSYEVERRMFGLRPSEDRITNDPSSRRTIRGLLPFGRDAAGRPGRMNSFSFVYPSVSLAALADPLEIAREHGPGLSLDEVRALIRPRVEAALEAVEVEHEPTQTAADLAWYWAAPLLLDRSTDEAAWMSHRRRYRSCWVGESAADDRHEDAVADEGGHDLFDEHLDLAAAVYRGDVALGPQPDDLVDVLVDHALGSPATVALRSLHHVFGEEVAPEILWEGACRIGWSFRSLFNLPDVNSMIRSADWEADFWRTATAYCVEGCLTAVLDEYLHVLRESIGLFDITPDNARDAIRELAEEVHEANGIRTTSLAARDHLDDANDGRRLRTRYAMRFGSERSETEASVVSTGHLRRSFNSPFWPFVLTSTSVGQEGLDFHLYCHAIVHWNLPGNPVDLEQREGRVHRFKGHAVRRNLASRMATAAWRSDGDPWAAMFDAAAAERSEADNELVPYWIFSGPATIERHVPLLPLSKEVAQLARLKRDVARYRLVFGQPRQDDLLEYLGDLHEEKLAELRIDLTPRPIDKETR